MPETGHHPNRSFLGHDGAFYLNGAPFYNDAGADISDSLEQLNSLAPAEIAFLDGTTAGTIVASKALVVGANKEIDTLATATRVLGSTATEGSATQAVAKILKKTGIADNAATAFLTLTIPNGNHSAAVSLRLLASCAVGTDAFESSRTATGNVVVARTTGANAVATAATLLGPAIATVSGGGTFTLAYDLSSVSGAVGAVNTVDVRVTIVMTGTITSHQLVCVAELLNAEASGVTMAAA